MKWYNPQKSPFKIYGFPFYEEDGVYRRMPLSPKAELTEAVYNLSNETAGGQIRFHAKLKELHLEVSLAAKPGHFNHVRSPHLAEVCKQSFDLYLSKDGKEFIFYDVSKNMTPDNNKYYVRKLLELEEAEEFDVLLNFPTYGGVDKVLIGVDDDAVITEPVYKFKTDKNIVIYGSSVQQGSSASRPGMALSPLLSRWLDMEVYDLGFNSSGKGEKEVATVIRDIKDTAALIINIEGNCPTSEWLDEKLREFIKEYRITNPDTPIVILPFIVSGMDILTPSKLKRRMQDREIQKKIAEDFAKEGDKNIYALVIDDTLEDNRIWYEMTVDGLHYTDLGFYHITNEIYKFLKNKILK